MISRLAMSTNIGPGRTIGEADNTWFTLLTMNQHPLHFDESYAARSEFGRPVVNSCLTLSIVAGMSVADVSQKAIANLGWTDIKLTGAGICRRHDLCRKRGSLEARVGVAVGPGHRYRADDRDQGRRGRLYDLPTNRLGPDARARHRRIRRSAHKQRRSARGRPGPGPPRPYAGLAHAALASFGWQMARLESARMNAMMSSTGPMPPNRSAVSLTRSFSVPSAANRNW